MKWNPEYNKELMLAHQFIKKQHEQYMKSDRIKSDDERRAYAHAVKIVGDIAYNCNICDKDTPNTHKAEFFNTVYDE